MGEEKITQYEDLVGESLLDAVKQVACNFAKFIERSQYIVYRGSNSKNNNKWYRQYTSPDKRSYYTTEELFEVFREEEKIRLQKQK